MSAEKYMDRVREIVMKWRGIPGGADIEPMIAALCAEIEQETRERCAKVAEEHAGVKFRGIILGTELADQLPHDGDDLAPMLDENSPASRLANEMARVRGHIIAAAIRAGKP